MSELDVHTNMGIPIATIFRYTSRRKSMYMAICFICSRGVDIAKIAFVSSFDTARRALESHLVGHKLDSDYVLKVTVTRGKSRVVEVVNYYYLARLHTEVVGSKAFAEGVLKGLSRKP
jgi:hypothetical protein